MTEVKRSKNGHGRTVYLSGVGLWMEGDTVHIRLPTINGDTTHHAIRAAHHNPSLFEALKILVERGDTK